MTTFSAQTFLNPYLARGSGTVHAVVTVEASNTDASAVPKGEATEIIIIDTSGSMRADRKLQEAKAAVLAAIDCLRDGVYFAVLAGDHRAEAVWPRGGGLAVAGQASRSHAKESVARVRADGGTVMGAWLDATRRLVSSAPAGVRHAILLTDGKNEGQSPEELRVAVDACRGLFQCDCRGVGDDWIVDELRSISSALLGSVDIVAEPSGLRRDFETLMRTAMSRRVADVSLRLWTPRQTEIAFVRQVAPEVEDLTDRAVPSGERMRDFPTGAWSDETRDYHVGLEVVPGDVGDEMMAGRVSLLVDGAVVADTKILVEWTDDVEQSTRVEPKVAAVTGQVQLAEAIQSGLQARRAGDAVTATEKLGAAVQLAHAVGDEYRLALLSKVVDIDDAPTGTVRLKADVKVLDEMTLDTRSTKTVRVR